ncbi:MAG: 50S ribosomal protein L21 [Clostridia bacterium]
MYAIIATGGKQFKVEEGLILKVEKLEAAVGDKIDLEVLMISDNGVVLTGKEVAKAKVQAEIMYNDKFDKIVIYKYKAKKNERKRQGHRQPYTAIKVLSITK